MKNSEWINGIGVVWAKEKNGVKYFTISLGDPNSKRQPVNVEVRVTDGSGKVLAQVTNPMLTVKDPRTVPGITEDKVAMIPESLKYRLSLPPAKD